MPRPSSRSAAPARSRWKGLALWAIPAVFVVAIVGYFVVKVAIDSYLRSESFRRFLAQKAGTTLRADCTIAPLQFTGANLFAENFQAQGGEDAPFASLGLDQMRAEISLRRFFEKVWQVEQVDVQRLNLSLAGPRAELPPAPPLGAGPNPAGRTASGWLPDRVEIATATVHDTNLAWSGGALRHTTVTVVPDNGGWKIIGAGGKIEQTGLPALDVQALALRYRAPSLFVNTAEFRQGGLGAVKVEGEINFAERLDLTAAIREVNITPFLSEDWRVRLKGQLSGDVTIRSALPLPPAGPEIAGTLNLARGELTALPVLDQIALFTGTQQFRRLTLSKASADFRQDGTKLRVTKFVAESEGLIRLEGDFNIEHGMIDGLFQVGVSATSLAFIPGSREKVFTESRGGYVWAPMRLTGPLNKPTEDLTARLARAAGDAVVETAKGAVDETIKTGKDTLKGVLDLLLPGSR